MRPLFSIVFALCCLVAAAVVTLAFNLDVTGAVFSGLFFGLLAALVLMVGDGA